MLKDRSRITPTLVKIYCRLGGHHTVQEFERGQIPPDDELLVYTWPDATLAELTRLVEEAWQHDKNNGVKFAFLRYTPSPDGLHWLPREMGQVYRGRRLKGDDLRLADLGYEAGDLIDVAIIMPPNSIIAK